MNRELGDRNDMQPVRKRSPAEVRKGVQKGVTSSVGAWHPRGAACLLLRVRDLVSEKLSGGLSRPPSLSEPKILGAFSRWISVYIPQMFLIWGWGWWERVQRRAWYWRQII